MAKRKTGALGESPPLRDTTSENDENGAHGSMHGVDVASSGKSAKKSHVRRPLGDCTNVLANDLKRGHVEEELAAKHKIAAEKKRQYRAQKKAELENSLPTPIRESSMTNVADSRNDLNATPFALHPEVAEAMDGGEGRIAEKVGSLRNDRGLGVLHLAAASGKLPVCRYLVEELCLDVKANCQAGITPLTCAIDAGSVDVVQYLLDHGADTETRLSTGLTPLVYAVGKALHCAAEGGRHDIVKILLDHHADPNMIAWGINRPLDYAISARSLECVKLLTEAGADVQGVGTETPLAFAATCGLTDILKCLVQAGADPNVRDSFGFTPIENAARYNKREDVEILFPVTSRIPNVHDWSVDGIIRHAKSLPALKDADLSGVVLANGKSQGREAVKNKDYLGAVEIYTKVMNLFPDDATLFSNRSLCWLRLGEGKKALVDAQACRMMRPDWSKACYREGAALMLLENYEKACGAFRDGLKLEPENAEMKTALRDALESLKISRSATKK